MSRITSNSYILGIYITIFDFYVFVVLWKYIILYFTLLKKRFRPINIFKTDGFYTRIPNIFRHIEISGRQTSIGVLEHTSTSLSLVVNAITLIILGATPSKLQNKAF